MAFDEDQKAWIGKITGGFETEAVDYAAAAEKMEKKREALDALMLEVEELREDLQEANEALTVTWEEGQKEHFWSKKQKEMRWMTGDRDEEIDTVHDLHSGYEVDPEKARRVQELHMKLVEIQTRMENAVDGEGNPLFTAKDIERELWSPLVRADVIPSNAVGDKYSQEAQVWNGACELYQEKLEDYTKTASKYDQVQRGLRIAGDTVSLIGTVAAESIKAANFESMAISREDTQKNAELADGKLKDVKASDVQAMNPTERAELAQAKGVPVEDVNFFANHGAKVDQANIAKRDMAYTQLAVGLVQGGLTIADKALDRPNKKKGFQIAELVYDAVETAALGSISTAMAHIKVSDGSRASEDSYKTMMGQITNLTKYGFKAGKLVFRAAELGEAYAEGNSSAAKAAAFAMVGSVAGAIGNAFAAFDRAGAPEDGGTGGQYAKIGAYVQAGILAASNVGKIVTEVVTAKREGREVNVGAIVAAVGLSAIGPVMAGTYNPLAEASREDITGSSGGVFQETEEERATRLKGITAAIEKAGGSSVDPSQMMTLFNAGLTDEATMKAKLAEELGEEEAEQKKKAIGEFRKSLAEDEEARAEFVAQIKREANLSAGALEKLMEEARAEPEDLEDAERAKKAMAAMDKLIQEAAALNAKWDMVNTLTSGGVSILVAALPVAGLAAAIQKLAMDIAILVRKSIELNKWFDNMALTYGNSSVYGPAIAGRLASAKVQVSQQTVRVVFDAIGVTSESLKLADITGISTAISIGNNMARALTEYGYKMAKEAECDRGWKLYKKARAAKGDRKLARKAMKWNSTLSKCVLAYGIVMDGDPIAKEVARSCGMTPEVLADQKDVCQKVVTYFETLYSDDAVILRRIPLTQDWHPGMPYLAFDSWVRFKAAAANRAVPPIALESTKTPLIDGAFSRLRDTVGMNGDYAGSRDKTWEEYSPLHDEGTAHKGQPAYREWLGRIKSDLDTLMQALGAYRPVTAACPPDAETPWTAGALHAGMMDIIDSYAAQAAMMKGEIDYDINQYEALQRSIEGRERLTQAQIRQIPDPEEETEETETTEEH